ncbi:sigma factor [Halomonas vilamensis]|uniref:RNA polymerase sigma factor n=1 Tax=Vreelandella vilamensis TaxID=531309 RepID=A0ABU1H2K1_9GAMM|nr:sigma factor [Halomonas vilamensis]MDR5898537.1 sigma factor [Halomonas vilamensis]
MAHITKTPCIEDAWQAHHQELRGFLLKYCGDRDAADELLQRVYAKALADRATFCQLATPKAWLFKVAKHQWIDEKRRTKTWVDADDLDLPAEPPSHSAIDSLADCIANALPYCPPEDADILYACDLNGVKQADYAYLNGLTLPATKARLRRARIRLRERLIEQCQIIFDEQGRVCCHRGLANAT